MKKKFTLVLSMLVMAGLVYDYHFQMAHTNSGGGPAGHTGSPGDGQSCARIGCHNGGPGQSNETFELTTNIPASGYVAGTTYNMTFTMTKTGGQKFGFQLSPQNASGEVLGTLAAGTGSSVVGGGDYLTHSFSGTSASGGTRSWSFQWTAPSSGTGDVIFYTVANFTNNNGSTSGDVVLTGSETFQEFSTVGVAENELASFNVYPNPVENEINIAFNDVDEEIMVTLFDISGKKVVDERFDTPNIRIDLASKSLNTGIYFLQLEVAGKSTVKKLLIK